MSSKLSKKLEKSVAADLIGGKSTPASGALPFWKLDIKSDHWLIEHKYTKFKSYSLSYDLYSDIIMKAFKEQKLPAMIVEFVNPGLKLAIIRYEDFLEYDKYINKVLNGEES